MKNKFQYITLTSAIGDRQTVQKIIDDYRPCLEAIGGIEMNEGNVSENLPLFIFVITGGTERGALEFITKNGTIINTQPIYIIAHSGNNSLPASLEILAKIKQEDKNGRIFYLNSPTDQIELDNISKVVKNLNVRNELRKAKIGLIGAPSEWLIASSPKTGIVSKYWGPKVIELDIEELHQKISEVQTDRSIVNELKDNAQKIFEPESAELEEAAIVYQGLTKIIESYKFDAVAVRCFDLVSNNKTTGCFALSQLNDEGIIAGCEGDIVSTIGMLWAYKMTGNLCWMANPSRIDTKTNSLILAHCTVPRNMITNYNLRSHFESGLGVGIEGELLRGPVTLFRIGGKYMDKLWIAEGQVIANERETNLCRTQIKIELNEKNKLDELISNPLGNHLLLIYGDHKVMLEEYWKFAFTKE